MGSVLVATDASTAPTICEREVCAARPLGRQRPGRVVAAIHAGARFVIGEPIDLSSSRIKTALE